MVDLFDCLFPVSVRSTDALCTVPIVFESERNHPCKQGPRGLAVSFPAFLSEIRSGGQEIVSTSASQVGVWQYVFLMESCQNSNTGLAIAIAGFGFAN